MLGWWRLDFCDFSKFCHFHHVLKANKQLIISKLIILSSTNDFVVACTIVKLFLFTWSICGCQQAHKCMKTPWSAWPIPGLCVFLCSHIGPLAELEYWRQRTAKFSFLVDQIKSQPCRGVITTLNIAKSKILKVISIFYTVQLSNYSHIALTVRVCNYYLIIITSQNRTLIQLELCFSVLCC